MNDIKYICQAPNCMYECKTRQAFFKHTKKTDPSHIHQYSSKGGRHKNDGKANKEYKAREKARMKKNYQKVKAEREHQLYSLYFRRMKFESKARELWKTDARWRAVMIYTCNILAPIYFKQT